VAFDVYSGGLARYYAREWENVAQAAAREQGMEYRMIYAEDSGPAVWDEVAECVGLWRGMIAQGLADNAPDDLAWSEDRDAPYYTDRPGWNGYTALVVTAACTALEEPLPDALTEDALVSDVVLRTHAPELRDSKRSITKVQIWLPGAFDFSFDFMDLCQEPTHLGNVNRLVLDLEDIQMKQGISDDELAVALQDNVDEDADFKANATFGLAVFLDVARNAQKIHMPIILSF
jgi:hypothetical protein